MILMAMTGNTVRSSWERAAQLTNNDIAFIITCGIVLVILVMFVLVVALFKK